LGGREGSGGVQITSQNNDVSVGYQAYLADEHAATAENGTWGPTLPKRLEETLPFIPHNVLFLGSPIGLFLTLRGAHPVFDDMRKKRVKEILEEYKKTEKDSNKDGKEEGVGEEVTEESLASREELDELSRQPELPFASPFTLPVKGSIFNIYHPSDPVAYRIEPLLLSPDSNDKDIPPPVHLTVEGEGLRFHIKAQELGDEITKVLEGGRGSITSFLSKSFSALTKTEDTASAPRSATGNSPGRVAFPLAGKGERLDFQLQQGVVDNQYLSSVTAHSSYFINTDVIGFLISLASKVETLTTDDDVPDTI